MSLRAILSGAVGKAAELRTSKNGNSFATLSIRENVNGATRWWQAIAFNESVIEAVKELSVGEGLAVAGEINAEIYAPAGSEGRINWRIVIDAILSARRPKAKPESTDRKPRAAKGRAAPAAPEPSRGPALAAASWASPSPLNDDIPF
jgi:hypothetical protein